MEICPITKIWDTNGFGKALGTETQVPSIENSSHLKNLGHNEREKNFGYGSIGPLG